MRRLTANHKIASRLFDVWCNLIAASPLWPVTIRRYLYAPAGIRLRDQDIFPHCTFTGNRFEIGARSWVNRRVFFDCLDAPIQIGSHCGIGMDVLFVTGSHRIEGPAKRGGTAFSQGIVVGNGVWIGARATVLPGVTIAEGCVIAAGAVVARSCQPNGLYAGVPARRIRDLPTDEAPGETLAGTAG